jgi:hypothetical protein
LKAPAFPKSTRVPEMLHSRALHVDGGLDILGPASLADYLQELVVGVIDEAKSIGQIEAAR